jgi:hypothetical protein
MLPPELRNRIYELCREHTLVTISNQYGLEPLKITVDEPLSQLSRRFRLESMALGHKVQYYFANIRGFYTYSGKIARAERSLITEATLQTKDDVASSLAGHICLQLLSGRSSFPSLRKLTMIVPGADDGELNRIAGVWARRLGCVVVAVRV